MLNFIKRFKKIILILLIPYLLLIAFFTIPTGYEAYLPGSVEAAGNVIKVDNNLDEAKNYYSTSVSCVYNLSLFQKLIFSSRSDSIVTKKSKYISTKEDILMGEIEHNSAIFTSIISAYELASIPLDYSYYGTYVYYTKDTNLKIGDIIIGSSYNDTVDKLNSKTFDVFRNGKILNISIDDPKKVYLEYGYYKINNNEILIRNNGNLGPSAGFMQSLKLYDDLIISDLSHNLKIAGTGTIDELGNVGEIGAVDIKIYTAAYNKVDIFFVPKENYAKAKETYDKLKTNMKLVMVETLSDAVNYLLNYE